MQVLLGIILHFIGGFASGSFYIPYKKVKAWAWESYWLVGGFFSWIIAPWVVAALTVPDLMGIISQASGETLFWTYLMGALWGIGGLTFGLTMRYLGMSLGMAIALGFCSAFGTLIPPLYAQFFGSGADVTFSTLLSKTSGQITLLGVVVCLVGIAICGKAGMAKEKELSDEQKKENIQEFNFTKGLSVAIFSGILSACMSFGFVAGKPIADLSVQNGVAPLFQNSAVLVVILLGGFTTNFIWCVILNFRNRSGKDYVDSKTPLLRNYIFSALAGITWYLQFMFYGMGSSKMGRYDFSSWTLHMAFIIIVSNLWGLYFNEWKGSSPRTMRIIILGIATVIFSTIVVGVGNYLGAQGQ